MATSENHMHRAGLIWICLGVIALPLAGWAEVHLDKLRLPSGFAISVLTDKVDNARQLALGDSGTLFVGTQREGKVYAIPNALQPVSGDVVTLARGLSMPSGVAFRGGDLYVGALGTVLRFRDIESHLVSNAPAEVVTDNLPNATHHGWKYLRFAPDGALYVPVGAPCNICRSEDPRFASILRMNPDSGETTVFARGIRNTLGFAWHPQTGHLWFTDNGADLMGDDIPAEEVNVATQPGQDFGYPQIHAGDIPDPKFGIDADPASYVQPVFKIQAHSAALGVDFYTGQQFPNEYRNALFIAEHGSWNRSSKVGYQISVLIEREAGMHYAPFISGWLDGQNNWGRPNDVLMAPDGSLLISDDQAGAVYRVTYR
ncbi:MAG: PQQ-dependent sugar dehydrogenase [Gammaproteobacteria bacterium]|nr:PQQ-dependent sugar dehydrogenase [Gammaproteobacteria bacterium]